MMAHRLMAAVHARSSMDRNSQTPLIFAVTANTAIVLLTQAGPFCRARFPQ